MTELAGTLRLARLAGRRDRLTLPAWILGLALFQAAVISISITNLPTRADLVQETQLMATTPALRMLGLPSGASVGGYAMVRGYLTIAVLAGVMSMLAVVRHTRQNEELGRAELVGATGLGRYAALAAAVLVATAATVLLGVTLTLVLVSAGQPAPGSVVAGLAVGAVGLTMVGVTAVTCQLSASGRGAVGWAGAFLGWSFLWQGVGNVGGTVAADGLRVDSAWPTWLSPLGWGQQMRPFGGDVLWPLLLFAMLSVGLLVLALDLVRRRDLGHGMLPDRRGRARARSVLLSPAGLSWRLQRGALVGWTVAMVGFGVVFGGLNEQIQDVTGSAREWYSRVGGTDRIVEAFQASIIQFVGMAVAAYAVQTLLRVHTDESGGTLEPVLATGTSRLRWLGGHLASTLLGSLGLLLTFAVTMGVVAGAALGDVPGHTTALLAAALVQLPAVCLMGGLVVAAVGVAPRAAVPVSWSLYLAAVLLGPFFAPSVGAPDSLRDLSPFTHVPLLPAAEVDWPALGVLALAAVTVAAAGATVLHRRDLRLPA